MGMGNEAPRWIYDFFERPRSRATDGRGEKTTSLEGGLGRPCTFSLHFFTCDSFDFVIFFITIKHAARLYMDAVKTIEDTFNSGTRKLGRNEKMAMTMTVKVEHFLPLQSRDLALPSLNSSEILS